MSKTLVIGANGKIAKLLVPKMIDAGISTVALVRDKASYSAPTGVEVVAANLEDDFSFAMQDCDRVIFSAGSGGNTGFDKTLLVDLWGASKAVEFAKLHNVRHFIMVSSRGADNPDNGPERIKPYLVAKYFADEYLIHSGVPYTILRPGRLIDEYATGLITTTRPKDSDGQIISREDVADTILYCLNRQSVLGKIYELFQGEVPIETAIG